MRKIYAGFLIYIVVLTQAAVAFGQIPSRGAGNKPVQTAEKRLALVMGNATYKNTTELANSANDATDMAQSLKSLGFEVLSGTNQSKRQMEILIREFGDKLAKQGGVGLFFYAGHGLQVRGQNYLVPIEADIPAEDEVEYSAVNLNFLLAKMDAAANNLNIVILDACRNNPFARSWRGFRDAGDGKGLAKVTPPTGTLMLYATQPGNVASDGAGRNGLFTESLLKQINKPNVELDQMVKLLARDVSAKSQGRQLPWKEGIVLGDFFFAGNVAAANPPNDTPNEPPLSVEIDKNAGEREAWNQIKDSTNRGDYALFIETFPNGIYAAQARARWEQTWWNQLKSGSNKSDYEAFLKQFPSGQYAGAAKFALKRLETTVSTEPNKDSNLKSQPTNSSNAVSRLAVFDSGKFANDSAALVSYFKSLKLSDLSLLDVSKLADLGLFVALTDDGLDVTSIIKKSYDNRERPTLDLPESKIVYVNTETFGDANVGIGKYVSAVNALNEEFKSADPKQKDVAARYQSRQNAVLGPIMQDIGKVLQDFAKQKGYAMIFDTAKLNQVGVNLGIGEKSDVTRDFIAFYNARPATVAAAAPPSNAPNKIVFVNTYTFGDDKGGITKYVNALNALQAEFKPLETELRDMGTKYQNLGNEIKTLQQQKNGPPPDQKLIQTKIDEYQKLERDLKSKQENAKAQYDARQKVVLNPIMQDISNVLQNFAKQKGYLMIFDAAKLDEAGIVLAIGNDKIDVTKDFIGFYNAGSK